MPSYEFVAVVTGASKGIGLAIVRQLALQYPSSPSNKGPLLIYLTARDKSRGEEALKSIENDEKLKEAKALSADGGLADVAFHELDITQTASVQAFREFLKKTHPEGIDVLVNNAAVAFEGFDYKVVKDTVECNYYGLLESSQDILPVIRAGGRVVNMASQAGLLGTYPDDVQKKYQGKYSADIQKRFRGANEHGEITALMEDFKAAVKDGKETEQGWPQQAYGVSKAGVIGLTRAMAVEEGEKGTNILINCCCPGYVSTSLNKFKGHKTVDEGAETPVMLALQNISGKSGGFWVDSEEVNW